MRGEVPRYLLRVWPAYSTARYSPGLAVRTTPTATTAQLVQLNQRQHSASTSASITLPTGMLLTKSSP